MTPTVKLMSNPLLRGTCETTPSHIWRYEAERAAIECGVDPEMLKSERIRSMLSHAYNAGESMGMAASSLVIIARESSKFDWQEDARAAVRSSVLGGK